MPFACDAARGITTERRASARLFPLPIKHQTSYINHVSMDPFSYLSPDFDHPGLGNDAAPRRRRRKCCRRARVAAFIGARRLDRESLSVFGGGMVDFLSLAQSAAVDVFCYLCSDFAHDLIPGLHPSFSPESTPDKFVNYKTPYYSNHRGFFVLLALYPPVDFVDTLLKGVPHLVALGPLYFMSSILFLAGLVAAAITGITIPPMLCHHLFGADNSD
jgi:hypothetical protein